jgi:HlyD family secretion protein
MRRTTIALLIILLVVLVALSYILTNPDKGKQLLVDLALATPEAQGYSVSGMLEAQVYRLATEGTGRVEELLVDEGGKVLEGRVVARLEMPLLEAELSGAKARYALAKARLDLVEAGPRQVDLAVARAHVDQAEAIWKGALQALEDARESDENIRDAQITLAQAGVDRAEASLNAARTALDTLKEGATAYDIAAAQAGVDAAAAEVGRLEDQLSHREIKAPSDGVILEHILQPHELALAGWPVVTMADLSELELTVYLPEADLNWAQAGDQVMVRVDAYPERIFSGKVIHISDQAEFTPRNVQTPEERVILVYAVRILVANPGGALKSGLPAEATFKERP